MLSEFRCDWSENVYYTSVPCVFVIWRMAGTLHEILCFLNSKSAGSALRFYHKSGSTFAGFEACERW